MGTDGMSYSLQSRDLIADSIETVMSAQWCGARACPAPPCPGPGLGLCFFSGGQKGSWVPLA